MTLKTCLRCDWEGETEDARCPSCGTRPLYVVDAPPSTTATVTGRPRSQERGREADDTGGIAPTEPSSHRSTPITAATEPLDPSNGPEGLASGLRPNRKIGALELLVAAVVVGVGALVLISRSGSDGTPVDAATTPAIGTPIYAEQGVSIVDLEGTTRETVAGLPDDARALDLSPDGSRIAFTTEREGGPVNRWSIGTIEIESSWLRPAGPPPAISAYDPAWSPDGTMIAFLGERTAGSGPTPAFEIYVMGADGSDLRKITSGPGAAESPRWSPDGSSITYFRRSPNAGGVWTVSLRTGASSRLIEESRGPALSYAYDFAYSPDGSRIAYSREGELGVMSSDGIDPKPIPVGEEPAFTPRWSPDGTMLAYTTEAPADVPYFRGGPLLQVNVVEIATGEHHPVEDLMVWGGSPPVWWSNDELLVRPVVRL